MTDAGAHALLVAALIACGCGGGGDAADDPFAPVRHMIEAAQSGDPSGLDELCDPEGGFDSDARRVCRARPEDERGWAIFRAWLGHARILGLASNTGASPDEVVIAVAMGPHERTVDVTVVRRGERWYLARF